MTIEFRKSGNRLIITFARPRLRNPISEDVISALESVFSQDELRFGVSEIVFTGIGSVFASGADINEIRALTASDSSSFALRGQNLMNAISRTGIATTAFINGYCYGGGLDLALACGRRIATPYATFCHPGARLGIITGWGGTQHLPRLIGEGQALELFFTAEPIGATEALRIGLVDDIADDLETLLLG